MIVGIATVGAVTASIAAWMVSQVQRDQSAAEASLSTSSEGKKSEVTPASR